MSSSANLVITPSTSLLLIRNVSTPTTVYLSSFNTPNFTVTIRDTTGSASIQTNPVYISTVGSARFLDGTSQYLLNKPYGLVNVGFRNSSFWQILHTSGQTPATAAATVATLQVSTATLAFLSSASKYASSLTIGDLVTTNALILNSPLVITNLSAPGIVVVQSSFTVAGNVTIDKELFVSGPTVLGGPVTVGTLGPLSSVTRVLGSIGVGTSLSVGQTVSVLSTLKTLSTNRLDTLQVQVSSLQTNFQVRSLQVQDHLSTLSSLTVTNLFTTLTTLTVYQTVSSLSETVSTGTLDVRGNFVSQSNISTLGTARFLGAFDVASSLGVATFASISTGLTSWKNLQTSSFSTVSISTLGSLSTSLLTLTSTASISSGVSTAFLQGYGQMSIGSYFYTPAVVSSLGQTRVGGLIDVQTNALLGSLHVSSSIGVGNNLSVRDTSYLGLAVFQGLLSTSKSLTTFGSTELLGNVGVRQSVFVNSNVTIQDFSQISSFFVNSFLLSNLDILTSSPSIDFTASTLNASSLQTRLTTIGITTPETLSVFSTFASTTQFAYATAENVKVDTVVASNVWWGSKQTSLAEASRPQFVLNTAANLPQGFSTQHVQGGFVQANTLTANFLGDGANISNIAVPYAHISGFTTFASSIQTTFLFTSSVLASSFTNIVQTTAVSSFQSPSFVIEGIGYPLRSDTNQILRLPNNKAVLNRKLFLDAATNKVGYNISSPLYNLDISGIFYTSNLFFSTINPLWISTQGTAFFSSIYTSSTYVRDSLRFATNGISIYASNTVDSSVQPFELQVTTKTTGLFGIYSYPSSIGLMNSVHVYNSTQRVMVNGLLNDQFLQPAYDFSVTDEIFSDIGHFSSVNAIGYAQSRSFTSPSLFLNQVSPYSTNSISSSVLTLYLNNELMTLKNETNPSFGVKQVSPATTFSVQGNAFFSSVQFAGIALANYLRLGSQLL
jgi:hypothetical protein